MGTEWSSVIIHSSNSPGSISNIPLLYLTLLWCPCFLFHHLLTLSLNHGVPQRSLLSFFFTFTPFGDFVKYHGFHCHPPYVDDFQISAHTRLCRIQRTGILYLFSDFYTDISKYLLNISILILKRYFKGLPMYLIYSLVVKMLLANSGDTRDTGAVPGLGRSPGGGHRNPLQYSCLENPTDRGAWQTVVSRVAKSQTWLKQLSMHADILNLRSKTKLLIFTTTSSNLHFLPYQLMIVPSFQTIWWKILELYFHSALFLCFHIQFTKILLAPPHLCNILLSFFSPWSLKVYSNTIIIVILGQCKSNHSLLCPVSLGLHFIN